MDHEKFLSKRWPVVLEAEADPERFPECLRPILQLFLEDAGSTELIAGIDYGRNLIIYGTHTNNELMLRLQSFDGYLTIARIGFLHHRQGYMKRLEGLLMCLARDLEYEGIRIECANTSSILAYIDKQGYRPKPNVPGDYLLSVSERSD